MDGSEYTSQLPEALSALPTLRMLTQQVQVQTANAQSMVDLFCGIAHHRASSMSTLSRALPGYLALLSSDDDNVFAQALDKLPNDHRIYQIA